MKRRVRQASIRLVLLLTAALSAGCQSGDAAEWLSVVGYVGGVLADQSESGRDFQGSFREGAEASARIRQAWQR